MLRASTSHFDRRRLSSLCLLCQRAVNVKRTPWTTPFKVRMTTRGIVQIASVQSTHTPVSTGNFSSQSTSIEQKDLNDPIQDDQIQEDAQNEQDTSALTSHAETTTPWPPSSDKSWQNLASEPFTCDDFQWNYGIARAIMNKLPGWEAYITEVAKARQVSPAPLGMQIYLWKLHKRSGNLRPEVVASLPGQKWWRLCEADVPGITISAENWARLFEIHSDEARCRKVLEDARNNRDVEWAMASFVIHFNARITRVNTLDRLFDLFEKHLLPHQNHDNLKDWRKRAVSCLSKLAHHCHRLEPRMLLRLPALTKVVLDSCNHQDHKAAYHFRCDVYNEVLTSSLPRKRNWNSSGSYPNKYLWEAQRAVLLMAEDYKPPLMTKYRSYHAIRRILSGLPKNHVEKLVARRHTSSWPPYLHAEDGLDEISEPEENWSRTVKAGAAMQEAGYATRSKDIALDILQGSNAKGIPTIQQRLFPARNLDHIDEWSARILATRNDVEAWQVFQELLRSGSKPTETVYASMFTKLTQRVKDIEDESLPGDKAINYVSGQPSNFTELETARLKPPSVAQLRRMMHEDGITLTASTLGILVGNANSLEMAHRYLRDSQEHPDVIELLTTMRRFTNRDLSTVSTIRLSLLRNYLQISCRMRDANYMSWLGHSMDLIELRSRACLQEDVSDLWKPVLKSLEQYPEALGLIMREQLQCLLRVMTQFAKNPLLWVFQQYNKTIRKALRLRVYPLLNYLHMGQLFHPMIAIFAAENMSDAGKEKVTQAIASLRKGRWEPSEDALIKVVRGVGDILEDTFEQLARKEAYTQRLIGPVDTDAHMSALDVMMVRQDPCRAEHAYQHMLTLAFLGKTKSMAKYLAWLIEQWSQPNVISELNEMGTFPAWTDFNEVLCLFRILAEPMLNEHIVGPLRTAIEESALPWRWPNDEFLDVFRSTISDETIVHLETFMGWIRHHQEKGTISPGLWREGQGEQVKHSEQQEQVTQEDPEVRGSDDSPSGQDQVRGVLSADPGIPSGSAT